MILSVTDGKETYEISLDSSLTNKHTGKPENIILLTNGAGESMSLYDMGIFRMIDDYFKKHY